MPNPTKMWNIYINGVRGVYSPTVAGPKVEPRGGSVIGRTPPAASTVTEMTLGEMGIDPETFEAAEGLAQQAGVSVDGWLKTMILTGELQVLANAGAKGRKKTPRVFIKTSPAEATVEGYGLMADEPGAAVGLNPRSFRAAGIGNMAPRGAGKK